MRVWNLKQGDPLSLSLAADARLGPTDYCDDQIWQLSLRGGDPPALALQTTFGLRARSLRLFPRFTEGEQTVSDPAEFAHPPVITHIYPNLIVVRYSPFPALDVEAGYWVPQPQGVTGRLQISSRSPNPRQIRLEWVAQLAPTEGERMSAVEVQAVQVLAGQTGGLEPVVFMTGGPQPGGSSYPSLNQTIDLEPGGSHQVTWAHAALPNREDSFNAARLLAARRWEAELARVELLNAGLIEIYTGDPDWDTAFALAQKQALSLFVGPTEALPHPSFVLTRQPDQGCSLRGDGSDYNYLWNGQPPLEAYYLAGLILPSSADLAEGIVRNYLAAQEENGFIDWKPGLAGQRSQLLATPVLTSLAWRIYETTGSRQFLSDVFPGLLRFVQTWFSPAHDRDEDNIPEWDHPMQAGSEDHPVYSRWLESSQGVEISTAESTALCAFLYRECRALQRMAEQLPVSEQDRLLVGQLAELAEQLRTAVEVSWEPQEATYHDWDRDTHFSPAGELLAQRTGPGTLEIQRSFEQPVRLLVRVQTTGESTRRPQVYIYGSSASGKPRIEQIAEDRFKWYLGRGSLTGERVYTALERIEIQGLNPEDETLVYSIGYRCVDQGQLLPLWAGIPNPERAEALVQETLTNPERFWRPHGVPVCSQTSAPPESACQHVDLPWNTLIGEGLLQYGYRETAAELVSRCMAGVVKNLKSENSFRRYYNAENGHGSGERDALGGLAPLGLFLETLGVRLISPQKVVLTGFNPFPWPVTVKYRGMTILRQKEKSMVIFPDGQTVVVNDPEPRIVSLESGSNG